MNEFSDTGNRPVIDLNWSDATMDAYLYPEAIQKLSSVHWTPIEIAKRASQWLAPKAGTRVLDIGSGVGKFCLIGACHTQGHFTGVEHRESLITCAINAVEKAQLSHVEFLHADMVSVDFSGFDAFYLHNPFFENVARSLAINLEVELSSQLYDDYNQHVYQELDKLPSGTRVLTYCSTDVMIPASYKLDTRLSEDIGMRFWVKR